MTQPGKKLKKLPIGIQTFSEIREEGYVYVDKTNFLLDMIQTGKYYFLARPRRFGKSLLVSTLQALFEGRKELFEGLVIYDQWDWNIKYPVIKISFGGVARNCEEMKQDVNNILERNQKRLGVACPDNSDIGGCLQHLIEQSFEKYGQKVVVLVDEYDKLIVDNLDQPEVAKEGREILRDLYTTIKDGDEYIKFAFLTGVSKFSRVSIFSGLNNLKDISLDFRYGSLCGYTQNDLETVFADHLQGADMDQVREWYNGYNFLGQAVYNPLDILLFIDNGLEFDNYWFATGTPTFLIKLIQQHNYFIPQLEHLQIAKTKIDSYDIDNIELEPILFQTGYLSIKEAIKTDFGPEYVLGTPNKEVAISFNDVLIRYLTRENNPLSVKKQLLACLKTCDLDTFGELVKSLFAAIPYNNYVKNTVSSYEGYYASVIYAYLASLGLNLIPEDVTNKGRIDLTIKLNQYIYLIEFKVGGEGKALGQIKARGYAEKYVGQGEVFLIGIDFDEKKKNVAAYEWEAYNLCNYTE
ncbi:MAG: ATP-binding protein [Deltaproteobacteria bacterium]|nr:ATP-binding protein [Deltaproteobacteria bacterium]